jgi:F0F1-type ATP synthase assembly protein I
VSGLKLLLGFRHINSACELSVIPDILASPMGKALVQRKPTAPVAQNELDRSLAVFAARKDFVSTALNMGWQMAITIIVPVFVGVRLDERFDSSPSYTLAALFIAIIMAVMVVARTIKQVNEAQKGGKS